jgi:hypothetical protein
MSKNVQIIIEHKEKTEQVKNIENTCSVHAERKIGSELLCRWIDDFKKTTPNQTTTPHIRLGLFALPLSEVIITYFLFVSVLYFFNKQ